MSKKLIIATTLVLNSLVIPYAVGAESNTQAPVSNMNTQQTTSTEMSKDEWLKAMEPMLPGLICKGFMNDVDLNKRFDELKISYDQCVTMIPDSEKKCRAQIYASIPEKINSDTAGIWGKSFGECIGKDFAEKHLMPQS